MTGPFRGFWEGDLIIGKGGKSQIATLVERTTRYTLLVKIPYDRTADRVAILLAMKMRTLPTIMQGSITWDQGKELARHAAFTMARSVPIYFCDPHSPWQRGSLPVPSTTAGSGMRWTWSGSTDWTTSRRP